MSARTDAPEMFANAPAPERVEADGTPTPSGVPMGRVVVAVTAAVLLVAGVALWSVSPTVALLAGAVALVVGGMVLLAPALAARRAAKIERGTRKRIGSGWRRWWRDKDGASRPSSRGHVFTGGRGRPLGGFRGGPRIGLPTGPSGTPAARAGDRSASNRGTPQSGLARFRQRFSRRGRSATTEDGATKSGGRFPFRRQQAPGPGNTPSRGSRRWIGGPEAPGDTSKTRRWRWPGGGRTPDGRSRMRRADTPQAIHPKVAAGRAPNGSSVPRLSPGNAAGGHQPARITTPRLALHRTGRWMHPVQNYKAHRQRMAKASKKPPERQTTWQYWFAPTKPVLPPKRKAAAKRETPSSKPVADDASQVTAPARAGNTAPITPLSADDAGFPHIPPPVHGRGPVRAAEHYDGIDTRLPVPMSTDRSSAASAFDDMGDVARPTGRKPKVTKDTDLSRYTSMVDTSTDESAAMTCVEAGDRVHSEGIRLMAEAEGLRDDGQALVSKGLNGARQFAEADEREQTARLRFQWADGFQAKATEFLKRSTSV